MMMATIRRLLGDFIRCTGGMVIRWIYQIQVIHPERLPAKGAALLLPNHVSFADGFFLSAACRVPVRFVMDETYAASPAVRLFIQIFETVTIRIGQPREAIRIAINALKGGDLVCLFPEGQLTRTGTLSELQRGGELIAKKAGYPVIPLWCDGVWGSIFSFERGRFFHKRPYGKPRGIFVSIAHAVTPDQVNLETLRNGMLEASASAIAKRFEPSCWEKRTPRRMGTIHLDASARRRIWVNGYQIGQVNALQRRQPFCVLTADPTSLELLGLRFAFPELFDAAVVTRDDFDSQPSASWVGGDRLREALTLCKSAEGTVFYDFGSRALEAIAPPGLVHCPCLAIDGTVISMSMPNPPKAATDASPQLGSKPGTWGKLLPGWFLQPSADGRLWAHGPAAPPDGIALPTGCFLDLQGFLTPASSNSKNE